MDADMNFISHWRSDLTNEEYHTRRDFFSSSQLKIGVMESMEAFHTSVNCPMPKVQTDAMRLGTLIHSAVLEGDHFLKHHVVRPDFSAYGHANSNAHKAAKSEWLSAHKDSIIVTEEDLDMLKGIKESIFKHPDALALLKGNSFEQSGFYRDDATGLPLRIRYDSYDKPGRVLIDLKSTTSVKKRDFANTMLKYRYDLSMAMYGAGIEAIDGRGPDDYVFIAVEKTAPYHVAVYPMSKRSLNIGLDDYRYALEKVAECQKTGFWPPYQSEMEEIDLPPYFEGRRNVR